MISSPEITTTSNKESILNAISALPICLRSDLDVSRQLSNSKVQYVIRDPLAFSSCALSKDDYQVFLHLESNQTVQQAYEKLVAAGIIAADQREEFYQFVLDLHQRNLIRLPILDGKLLYKDFTERREKETASLPIRLLSYQVPLVNPDRFLEATLRFAKPMFRSWFLVAWMVLVGVAAYVVSTHWGEFTNSTSSLLALKSLPVLLLILCVLKLFHELGHAYACKLYGGHVPEMGLIFIIGTPCAYVDTSAAWGFRNRWQRIVVNLAGMYFESLIAISAVFVWSLTPPGLLHSVAHYTIVLATVVTVLFNANPLLKFDGYYILSDSLGIPNLKRVSSASFIHCLKRTLLGVESPRIGNTPGSDRMLCLFGAASESYRIVILLGIVTFLSLQVPAIGLAFGLFYLFATMLPGIDRLGRYLFSHPETVSRRPRVLAMLASLGVCAAFLLTLPLSSSISFPGIVGRENETFIRALEPGFVSNVGFEPSQKVQAGELLFELTNEELMGRYAVARADVAKLHMQWVDSLQNKPDESGILLQKYQQAKLAMDSVEKAMERLTIRAPQAGVLTEWQSNQFAGRFIKSGEPLVKLESGKWIVRALATDEEILDTQVAEGDSVEFDVIGHPGTRLSGRVVSVSKSSQEKIEDSAFTHVGGGDIDVDPYTQKATKGYFLVVMEIDTQCESQLRSGIRVQAMAINRKWSLGRSLSRKLWQFYHRYLMG
jgi:putative peptide zinc metalloprotease protein